MQDLSHPTVHAALAVTDTTLTETAAMPEEGVSTMFCTQCGIRNGSDARYCKQCGHKLERTGPLKITDEEFELPQSRDEKVRGLMLVAFQKYEAKDLEGAVGACSEALALRPESTDAHSLMSTLYEKMGEREKAIAERERVLELNPGSIADREKLDELKSGHVFLNARKITSSHRRPASSLIDSPAAQALAAVFVMLVVLTVGVVMLWAGRTGKQSTANAANHRVAGPQDGISTLRVPGGTQPALSSPAQPPAGAGPQNHLQTQPQDPQVLAAAGAAVPGAGLIGNSTSLMTPPRRQADRREAQPLSTRQIDPAPVSAQLDSQGGRLGTGALPDRGSTVILPDTGPDTTPGIGAGPVTNSGTTSPPPPTAAASQRTQSQPQGRIEIIVSPGPQANGGRGTSTKQADNGNGSSLDSRSALEIARDLHNKGQYNRAINSYKTALDGAGDGAADIHQKIALCYYRLNDKENAISHYQQAIDAFKAQITAGRNVESARNGVRACENGIKVCQ